MLQCKKGERCVKVNYKLKMDEQIKNIKSLGIKPDLLLHACCAPCSSAVLELLNEYFNITLFFYNPNISPENEFNFRLAELKSLPEKMMLNDIKVISPKYDYTEFERIANGMESEKEGGARCYKCYYLRLEKTMQYAKENGFDFVCTTLSISPYKNSQWLNEIGLELEKEYGVKYLCSDFKKGDGYKRSCTLSKEYDLYRQNYCGCVYSKIETENK